MFALEPTVSQQGWWRNTTLRSVSGVSPRDISRSNKKIVTTPSPFWLDCTEFLSGDWFKIWANLSWLYINLSLSHSGPLILTANPDGRAKGAQDTLHLIFILMLVRRTPFTKVYFSLFHYTWWLAQGGHQQCRLLQRWFGWASSFCLLGSRFKKGWSMEVLGISSRQEGEKKR